MVVWQELVFGSGYGFVVFNNLLVISQGHIFILHGEFSIPHSNICTRTNRKNAKHARVLDAAGLCAAVPHKITLSCRQNNSPTLPWCIPFCSWSWSTHSILEEEVWSLRRAKTVNVTRKWMKITLWCGSPSHRYFCTTEIRYPVFPRSPIPLAKTIHLMRGDDWLEEIQIGSKLTEI